MTADDEVIVDLTIGAGSAVNLGDDLALFWSCNLPILVRMVLATASFSLHIVPAKKEMLLES
jgi:hypothetical protein